MELIGFDGLDVGWREREEKKVIGEFSFIF